VGWNIDPSYTNGAAKAMGTGEPVPHDERYLVADEYMEVVYKLWESSWAPDSVVWSYECAYDPTKIRKIKHKGRRP
jgi:alkanesulfonate monooxygenase SsuD/methylene tetrahydromethanopterin reductase-like flavin-dependent oxidoreductase (luciferase family)